MNIPPDSQITDEEKFLLIKAFQTTCGGTSLVAQWLRLCAPNAGGPGSTPGQGTRSHMHASTKEPACCN